MAKRCIKTRVLLLLLLLLLVAYKKHIRDSLDICTCCHTETEAADQICHITQSDCTDTGPTSPSNVSIIPGVRKNSHFRTAFLSERYDSTRKSGGPIPGSPALEADILPQGSRSCCLCKKWLQYSFIKRQYTAVSWVTITLPITTLSWTQASSAEYTRSPAAGLGLASFFSHGNGSGSLDGESSRKTISMDAVIYDGGSTDKWVGHLLPGAGEEKCCLRVQPTSVKRKTDE